MIEVEVEDPAWACSIPDVAAVVVRAAEAALEGTPGNVVVLLADDAAVRELNFSHRDRDAPTNVLSFPAAPIPGFEGPQPLGDIVLAFGVCAAEAAAQGKRLEDHLSHLTIHGVLHLLGHDHEDDAEAEAMEAMEREILAGLGIADPYAVP